MMEPVKQSSVKRIEVRETEDYTFVRIVWHESDPILQKQGITEYKSIPYRFTKEEYEKFKKDMEPTEVGEYLWKRLRKKMSNRKEERAKRKHMKHLTTRLRFYLGLKKNDMKDACLFDLIRSMSPADIRHLNEEFKDKLVRGTGVDEDMLFGRLDK